MLIVGAVYGRCTLVRLVAESSHAHVGAAKANKASEVLLSSLNAISKVVCVEQRVGVEVWSTYPSFCKFPLTLSPGCKPQIESTSLMAHGYTNLAH